MKTKSLLTGSVLLAAAWAWTASSAFAQPGPGPGGQDRGRDWDRGGPAVGPGGRVEATPREAPPRSVIEEVVTRAPGPDYVWIPGHWAWQARWTWIKGHWERRPRAGVTWSVGYWTQRAGIWIWVEGQWVSAGVTVSVAPVAPQTIVVETVTTREAPPTPKVEETIPAAPAGDYLWVSGHWSWKNGWVWAAGFWQVRPDPNAEWVSGSWTQSPGGWTWSEGHWVMHETADTTATSTLTEVYVTEEPPAPRVETVTVAPGPDYRWSEGHWAWEGRWVWTDGHWIHRPGTGSVWVAGQWSRRDRGWVWAEGHWR